MPQIVQPVRLGDARFALRIAPLMREGFRRDGHEQTVCRRNRTASRKIGSSSGEIGTSRMPAADFGGRGDELAANTDTLTADMQHPRAEINISAPKREGFPAPKASKGHERKSHVAGDDRREALPICALDGSTLLALMFGLVHGFDGIFPQML